MTGGAEGPWGGAHVDDDPFAGNILDAVRAWLARFVITISPGDLDVLAIWAVHTHVAVQTYTTPRLLLDSPMPGSGKTTCLEHLQRLCLDAVQIATLSSPALLTRMLDQRQRTILIDEADRSLDPSKEGIGDLLAVLNSGYKVGATRPVLVPGQGGQWETRDMPTFAPVAMAGNNPRLPDDTRTRAIRIVLWPDLDGAVEESDWELIEDDAAVLAQRIETWAGQIRDQIKMTRPSLPAGIVGRYREKWFPLRRVAELAGGRWPAAIDALAIQDKEQQEMDRQDGLVTERPAVLLLKHLGELWPPGETFVPTASLLKLLISAHPDVWGVEGPLGKSLTAHRFGRMLAQSYLVNSTRPNSDGPRGYAIAGLSRAWGRMNLPLPKQPAEVAQAAEVAQSGPVQPVQPLQPVHPEGVDAQADPYGTSSTEGAYPKCEVCGHDLWAPQSQAAGICARCAQAKAAS